MNLILVIIFVFLCYFLSLIELSTRKTCKVFFLLACLFVYMLASRDIYTVPDTLAYVRAYQGIPPSASWNVLTWNHSGFEDGYMFINFIAKKLGLDYRGFFGLVGVISIYVYNYALREMSLATCQKQKKLQCVMFSLWACSWGVYYSGIVLRAGIAISLIFATHMLILRRKFFAGCILACFACTIHNSCMFYIIIFFAAKTISVHTRKAYILWLVGIILIWLSGFSFLLNKLTGRFFALLLSRISPVKNYSFYLYGNQVFNILNLKVDVLKSVLLVGAGFVFIKLKPRKDIYYSYFLNFYMIYLSFTFIFSSFMAAGRVGDFGIVFFIPLFYRCITTAKMKLFDRLLLFSMFLIPFFAVGFRWSRVVL